MLARRRFAVSGRFGLRATPGGFATPAFGPPDAMEVVRVSGTTLLVEVGGGLAARAIQGSTLSELAGVVGVDLDAPFDAGASVAVGAGHRARCNIGASPGDAAIDEPYVYVGPWGSDRPGDPAFWNAPFGAVLRRGDVDSVEAATAFLDRGIDLLRSTS